MVEEVASLLTQRPQLLSNAESIDICNLIWAIAQIDVAVSPNLLQAFTVNCLQLHLRAKSLHFGPESPRRVSCRCISEHPPGSSHDDSPS